MRPLQRLRACARSRGCMADVGRNLRGSAPELGGLTALRLVEGSLALEGLRFEAPEQCWSSGGWLIVESCSSWCLEAASGSMRVGPGGRSMRGESRCFKRTLYSTLHSRPPRFVTIRYHPKKGGGQRI